MQRKINKFFLNFLKINLVFWYKHIPLDDFKILQLYDNIMLVWLFFKERFCVFKNDVSFRLNVYYTRAVLKAHISYGNFFLFMDILVNFILPVMRKSNLCFYFVNEKLILSVSDLSFFASTKLGKFFYVENVLDKLLIEFDSNFFKIVPHINLFKIDINGLSI